MGQMINFYMIVRLQLNFLNKMMFYFFFINVGYILIYISILWFIKLCDLVFSGYEIIIKWNYIYMLVLYELMVNCVG